MSESLPKTGLFAGKYLSLVREGHWEYVERVNATGAAIIVATTDQGEVLLVEQYRIPVHAQTIEFPAGITGDRQETRGTSEAEAARRELLEETGYAAGRLELLTVGPASSGLTSEVVGIYRATGLRHVNAGGGVGHEEITVHAVPLARVRDWLRERARSGLMIDPKVYAGLYLVQGE